MKFLRSGLKTSLIIIDNEPYHSIEVEKQQSFCWRKAKIVDRLDKYDVTYVKYMLKADLLDVTKLYKRPNEYKLDQLLQKHGHEVLSLLTIGTSMELK